LEIDEKLAEAVLWDGDQIGFFVGPGQLCMSLTDEDFENGEIDFDKRLEIRRNEQAIRHELARLGLQIVEE